MGELITTSIQEVIVNILNVLVILINLVGVTVVLWGFFCSRL